MKTFFLLLRIGTGLMAAGGIFLLLAIVFLRSLPGFAKHAASIIGYLAVLFTSGFTKGTEPKDPGWVISLPQVALALLFLAMLVSAFLPGAKIFLHVVAGFVALPILWYVWMAMTEVKLEIFCLPVVVIWLVYYAFCIFWYWRQPLPIIPGS
jgi:hypothetical protein